MDAIFSKAKNYLKQELPFVLYRKPDSQTIVAVFQDNKELYFCTDFKEKGFVFAPFDQGDSVLFPLNFSTIQSVEIGKNNANATFSGGDIFDQVKKEAFIAVVEKGIAAINEGLFSKVVLSRKEAVILKDCTIETIFNKILQEYPTAFCYCWFHPKVGLWLGATPETLLRTEENAFSTMALAGTQSYKGNETVLWESKEKDEQEFVTSYIIKNLKKTSLEIAFSEPYTTRAGNLLHLKTDITGILAPEASLKTVLQILHPTPAVCGLPKQEARDFILKNEGYNREFYTGFLGELNYDFTMQETASDLYVNLRCMKIEGDTAQLFMGCGITKDSNPEAEWQESVNKSKIMKRVL